MRAHTCARWLTWPLHATERKRTGSLHEALQRRQSLSEPLRERRPRRPVSPALLTPRLRGWHSCASAKSLWREATFYEERKCRYTAALTREATPVYAGAKAFRAEQSTCRADTSTHTSMSALVLVRHSARTFSTAARTRVLCPAGLRWPGHENRMLGKSERKGEESARILLERCFYYEDVSAIHKCAGAGVSVDRGMRGRLRAGHV